MQTNFGTIMKDVIFQTTSRTHWIDTIIEANQIVENDVPLIGAMETPTTHEPSLLLVMPHILPPLLL